MKRYSAPKGIVNHPGVLECTCARSEGNDDPGRRHFVVMRDGWHLASKDGMNGKFDKYDESAVRTMAFVDSVADFKDSQPERFLNHPAWK